MSNTVLEFLITLDSNLGKSLDKFNSIKEKSNYCESLDSVIQSINNKLHTYILDISKFKDDILNESFEKETQINDDNQFLLSFNIDKDLHKLDFKEKFKETIDKDISLHKMKPLKNPSSPLNTQTYKNINSINNIDISPNKVNIPIIRKLHDMTPMFYWYDGDAYYKKGIYTCISNGFYVRVPFPNTKSINNQNFKTNSIPCKYETKEICSKNKKAISDIYKTEVRYCSYVHKKERFEKIGSGYKCSIEDFGNHIRLNSDLDYIKISDIKRILMYALSDALLSTIWHQNKFEDGDLIINNLDIY
jgi:hypothetical protein